MWLFVVRIQLFIVCSTDFPFWMIRGYLRVWLAEQPCWSVQRVDDLMTLTGSDLTCVTCSGGSRSLWKPLKELWGKSGRPTCEPSRRSRADGSSCAPSCCRGLTGFTVSSLVRLNDLMCPAKPAKPTWVGFRRALCCGIWSVSGDGSCCRPPSMASSSSNHWSAHGWTEQWRFQRRSPPERSVFLPPHLSIMRASIKFTSTISPVSFPPVTDPLTAECVAACVSMQRWLNGWFIRPSGQERLSVRPSVWAV